MKRWKTGLMRVLLIGAAVPCLMWLFGPYEPTYDTTTFQSSKLDQGVATDLRWREAQIDGIAEGVEKRVIWAAAPETQTELSIVYLHGFSATSQEIRPVPDDVAKALGANLVFARLTGHGRDGGAMAQATVQDWVNDTVEAIAVGRKVGRKLVVIATSTGGTLAAALAVNPAMAQGVSGIVMISPNFGTATMHALFMFSDEDRVVDANATRKVMTDWRGPTQLWQPELTDADDPFAHVIAGDIMSPAQTDAVVDEIANWIGALK